MPKPTLAIIGNPNCGKTTLFNILTGCHQKVGNWPGVTVDKKTGCMTIANQAYNLVDLPGVYSLTVGSTGAVDEQIATQFIANGEADLYINIVDAANLKRNLYLTMQLLEMNVPCIVAVNMLDVAKLRGIDIDMKALSKQLGVPVVPLVSTKKQGIDQLQQVIADYADQKPLAMTYAPEVEARIVMLIRQTGLPRWQVVRLLEQDGWAWAMPQFTPFLSTIKTAQAQIADAAEEDADILIADGRYQQVARIVDAILRKAQAGRKTFTQRLDNVVMHRFWGIPIFLFIMYLMFELSMNIGTLLQPFFDISSSTIFIHGADYWGVQLGLPMWLTAIFGQGIGLGINTVVNFIPQIGLMFLFLAFLEDSGYMARAAFVMDRFMQFAGLPGKSFVPLIVGFGCNVPSIMATRSLDSRRDRIMTSMMAPFMSCGARLAIFVVFASAFFPEHGGLMVFMLYLTGIVVAILTGLVMKKTLLKGESSPFVMELPAYHLPNAKSISWLTWRRLKRFVIRAGKVIVPICVLVGSLNAILPNGTVVPMGSRDSILSHVGRDITPVLAPMGVRQDNWPATVGLITGTLAKEVVVGTLNTLYTQRDHQSMHLADYSVWRGLKQAVMATVNGFSRVFSTEMMNPFTANEANHDMSRTAIGTMVVAFGSALAAFSYLLFVLLYVPCVSTIGVLIREAGHGWAWLSTFWSFSVAYTAAVIVYQAGTLTQHVSSSLAWIIGLLLFQTVCILALRWFANQQQGGMPHVAH